MYNLGRKGLGRDAEELAVLLNSRSGGIPPGTIGESTWYRIWVVHHDGSDPEDFDVDDAGLAAAILVAAAKDTILIPPATFANDYTWPDGVSVLGQGSMSTIFTGQLSAAGNGYLRDVAIERSASSGSDMAGFVGPTAGGYFSLNTVKIIVANSGAGGAYGTQNNGGTLAIRECYLEGTASGGGSGYGAVGHATGETVISDGTSLVGSTARLSGANIRASNFEPEIQLHDSAGALVGLFAFSSAGFDAASTAATSGDVIRLPAGTVSGDHTLTAGVEYVGQGREKTILSGQITGANGSVCRDLSISRAASSADALTGFIGPGADEASDLVHCDVTAAQAGSGNAYAIAASGGGDIRCRKCTLEGTSGSGSGYAGRYTSGNLYIWGGRAVGSTNRFVGS